MIGASEFVYISIIRGSCLEAFEFEAELRAVIVSHSKEKVPESLMRKLAMLIEEEEGLKPDQSSE